MPFGCREIVATGVNHARLYSLAAGETAELPSDEVARLKNYLNAISEAAADHDGQRGKRFALSQLSCSPPSPRHHDVRAQPPSRVI
jgi:hypothetical protein